MLFMFVNCFESMMLPVSIHFLHNGTTEFGMRRLTEFNATAGYPLNDTYIALANMYSHFERS